MELYRNFLQLDNGKVQVMVVAQERPDRIAEMNPPCHCDAPVGLVQDTWSSQASAPTYPKLQDLQGKLDGMDSVKDWSAVVTKANTAIFDSFYDRCMC